MSGTAHSGRAEISVVVVDDHPMWRDAVARDLIDAGFTVVGTASSGAQALRVTAATNPLVVLLDLQLPDATGAEVTRRLRADRAETHPYVLMLSSSGEQRDVLDAVKCGATGYLMKTATKSELVAAVEATASGRAVFSPGLAGLVLGEFRQPAGSQPANTLTAREIDVLRLVALGRSYKQIAEQLVVSHRTVQNHVQNVLGKLQMNNRVQLARYAVQHGLDEPTGRS